MFLLFADPYFWTFLICLGDLMFLISHACLVDVYQDPIGKSRPCKQDNSTEVSRWSSKGHFVETGRTWVVCQKSFLTHIKHKHEYFLCSKTLQHAWQECYFAHSNFFSASLRRIGRRRRGQRRWVRIPSYSCLPPTPHTQHRQPRVDYTTPPG